MSQKTLPVVKDRDIAIVGMSCLFPEARNLNEFWTNIVSKKDCISDVPQTHWNPEDYFSEDLKAPDKTYCKRGGFLPFVEFDPMQFGIGPKDLDVIDTAQLLGMKIARDALKDAGYLTEEGGREFDRDRCAAIVGTTSITELTTPLNKRLSYPVIDKVLKQHGVPAEMRDSITRQYRESYPIWQENSFPGVLGNVVSGRIASHLNLGGTNCVIDAACASALGAVKMAADALLTGTCDMAITGGVDTENNIFMYMCFSKTPAFSKEGKSRPFDASSDGILIAEGIGLMVLKRYQDAIRDGDRIYAVMRSIGSSSDGRGKSIYQPVSEGQAKAVRQAYELANVTPRDVELLEAHGTGTPVGDMKEFTGLKFVYSDTEVTEKWCAIGSVKSQIGHSKASAGIAGVIKAALSIYHHVLPPTINVHKPNPAMEIEKSPFYINSELRPWVHSAVDHRRRAGTSAFGFGGTNFHVLLEQHDDESFRSLLDPGVDFVAFADENSSDLLSQIKDLITKTPTAKNLSDLCSYLRHRFDSTKPCKASIVATDLKDLESKLIELHNHLEKHPKRTLSTRNGVFFLPGEEFQDAKVAVLFPGQGSQYLGMFRELISHRAEFQEALQNVNQWRVKNSRESLNDIVFPQAVFDKSSRQQQSDYLTRTDNTQAGLSFANLGAFHVLRNSGLQIDAVAGHSFGELSALHASGVLDFDAYMQVTHRRGDVMKACNEQQGGAMLAVLAPKEQIMPVVDRLRASGTNIEIANYNSPKQVVLSGSVDSIGIASAELEAMKLRCIPLNVGAAFHSSLMQQASAEFANDLKSIKFSEGTIPVYSNTIADKFPAAPKEKTALIARQLRESVHFEKMIRKMVADGFRVFVEAGPSGILGRLINQILEDEPHVVLSIDAGELQDKGQEINLRNRFTPLAMCLAHLTAMGKVNLVADALGHRISDFPAKPKQSPVTIKLNGANFLRPEMRQVPFQAGSVPLDTVISAEINKAEQRVTSEFENRLKQKSQEFEKKVNDLENQLKQSNRRNSDLEMRLGKAQSDLQNAKVRVPSDVLKAKSDQKEASSVSTLVRGKSDSPVYRASQRRSEGNIMSKKMSNRTKGVIEEYNDYRFKMLEVHEQFLQMQSDANRLFERMVFNDNQAILGTDTELEFSPLEFSEPVVSITSVEQPLPAHNPVSLSQSVTQVVPSTLSPNEIKPVSMVSTSETGWKSPEAKVASHTEKNGSLLSAMFETAKEQPSNASSPFTLPKLSAQVTGAQSAINGSGSSEIEEYLIATIAEKTGFPLEMIEAGMDLEEDLAVDSIRRVEILGAVQERFPNAPTIGPSQLGILKSVGDIAEFLSQTEVLAAPKNSPANKASSNSQEYALSVDAPVTNSAISDFLMQTIADKTGFPLEMITPDMRLEEDLAVDSIRRVEILGAVQEKFPDAPTVGPEQLGVLQSIEEIVVYLNKNNGSQAPLNSEVPRAIPLQSAAAGSSAQILEGLMDVISDKTGFPLEMLTPDMDLESDLAVDSIRRVEILGALQERFPHCTSVGPAEMGVLKTIEDLARHMGGAVEDALTISSKKKSQLV